MNKKNSPTLLILLSIGLVITLVLAIFFYAVGVNYLAVLFTAFLAGDIIGIVYFSKGTKQELYDRAISSLDLARSETVLYFGSESDSLFHTLQKALPNGSIQTFSNESPKEFFDAALIPSIDQVKGQIECERIAIDACARIKPGGKLVICSTKQTTNYAATLNNLHWNDVAVSKEGYGVFPANRVISATKPETITE